MTLFKSLFYKASNDALGTFHCPFSIIVTQNPIVGLKPFKHTVNMKWQFWKSKKKTSP